MRDIKRVFISDIHMASHEAVTPAEGKHPYGWLSPADALRLGEFLRSSAIADCQELFIVGDGIDVWTCPYDIKPPTPAEIINAPHNRPIVDGLRAFADKPDHRVFYLKGNHDHSVTAEDARLLVPGIIYGPHYEEYPLRVYHGHEEALFNAEDPAGRKFPLGYFITRLTATAAARGASAIHLSFRTILNSGGEVLKLLKSKPLAECVIDTILRATGVKLEDKVVMPDGSTIEVGNVRETYQNLVNEWNEHRSTSAVTAVMCEWDPYNALEPGKPHLNIMGHSHDRRFSYGDAFGMYLNLGAWCDGKAHYAKTWIENPGRSNEILCGQLYRWTSGGAEAVSPHAGVPTK